MNEKITRLASALTSTKSESSRRYRNGKNTGRDLTALIEALGWGPVERDYEGPGGTVDIYVPHHRVMIQADGRTVGNGPGEQPSAEPESTKARLDGVMLDEIQAEWRAFGAGEGGSSGEPWVGIVTDGATWRSWLYAHGETPSTR